MKTITTFWLSLADEDKLLLRKIAFASIALYALLQFISFILPVILVSGIGVWMFKQLFYKNPKILK